MPIYEYRCHTCGRRIQLLFRSFGAVGDAQCPHCGSMDLGRLPSRVSYVRSEAAHQDFLSDASNLENIDYNNPRAVAEWARRMGEAAGVDTGSDYEEMVEQLEQGGGPEDFPDYGSDSDPEDMLD